MVYGDVPGLSPVKRQRVEGRDSAEKESCRAGGIAAASAATLDEIGAPLMTATSNRLRPEKNRLVAAERAEARKYVMCLFSVKTAIVVSLWFTFL